MSRIQFRRPRAAQAVLLHAGKPPGLCVAIEGPIGVGKTTLTRLLARKLDAVEMLEVVEENPFLHHFYQDIRTYAFQTQIFFFLSRYRQQAALREEVERGRAVVSDYMFAKDRLFARMNLDAHEWDLYERLYGLIAPMTAQPDLVIYLTAELSTLLRRITHRDRPFERAIEPAYLDRLRGEYERFFGDYEETALLTVDTETVDIYRDADLEEILRYAAEVAVP
jgi:deoxyadenosine/deoxycytidine kinase